MSALTQEYARAREALRKRIKRITEKGIALNYAIPEKPKKVTKASIKALKKMTREKLLSRATLQVSGKTLKGKQIEKQLKKQSVEKRKETVERKKRETQERKYYDYDYDEFYAQYYNEPDIPPESIGDVDKWEELWRQIAEKFPRVKEYRQGKYRTRLVDYSDVIEELWQMWKDIDVQFDTPEERRWLNNYAESHEEEISDILDRIQYESKEESTNSYIQKLRVLLNLWKVPQMRDTETYDGLTNYTAEE